MRVGAFLLSSRLWPPSARKSRNTHKKKHHSMKQATATTTPAPSRRRGRPRKGMAAAAIAADIFDTVPMMRLSALCGTKGIAAAMAVLCAVSRAGYCLEWTEREKWATLRLLPGMEAAELDEAVRAMAVAGMFDETAYVRHGVLTSRDIQAAYFADHRRTPSLPYLLDGDAEAAGCTADAPAAVMERKAKETAAAPSASRVTASVTAYTADGIVYYGQHAVYSGGKECAKDGLMTEKDGLTCEKDGLTCERGGLMTEKDGLMYEKGGIMMKKAELMHENADLMPENACLSADKEKETKKETDKETAPAPPKEREKEINKEKETADVVPTSVSCRHEADDDAARKTESSATAKGESLSKSKTAATAKDGIDYATVRREWNRLMQGTGIPLLRSELSGQRQRMFRARVRENGKNTVWRVMLKAAASTYLGGGGPSGWTATFDWLMRPSNFQKVLDGHYDNSRTEARRRRVVLGVCGRARI